MNCKDSFLALEVSEEINLDRFNTFIFKRNLKNTQNNQNNIYPGRSEEESLT